MLPMKKKRKNQNTTIMASDLSFIQTLFNPTIDMAAELMNVPTNVVKEWLDQEHLSLVHGDRLTDNAIDFLSKKYLARLHKYFDNCIDSWTDLEENERVLFNKFRRKYGSFILFWVWEWKDLDHKMITRDFKNELEKMAQRAYFPVFCSFEAPTSHGIEAIELDGDNLCFPHSELTENSLLLSTISHSLYYRARIKTRIPNNPVYRDILLEVLQENRFHIFTEESDSNDQIEAISQLFKEKQPQFTIATINGYLRRKNRITNECHKKNKAYCCC